MSGSTVPDELANMPSGSSRVLGQRKLTHAKQSPHCRPPVEVVLDATLSLQARMLYVILDARAGARGYVHVRQDTLAGDLGCSVRQVQRAMKELRERGLVEVQQTKAVARLTVVNEARHPVSDPPRVSHPDEATRHGCRVGPATGVVSSNTELINTKQSSPSVTRNEDQPRIREELTTVAEGFSDPIYLEVYVDALPARFQPDRSSSQLSNLLGAAQRNGWEAVRLAQTVVESCTNPNVRNPAGLALTILKQLSQQPAREYSTRSETPIPPRWDAAAAEAQRQNSQPMPEQIRAQLQELAKGERVTA